MSIRIGILRAGGPPAEIGSRSYPDMIRAALGPAFDYIEFSALEGELPQGTDNADGYIITGSSSSAYNTDPWISTLSRWIEELDPSTPLLGICFGHQLMAQTYGGKVRKSDKGWGLGLHRYEVKEREPWMGDCEHFTLPTAHYDQVELLPPDARVLGGSDFCPNAAISYGRRRSISFQAHPEFERTFATEMVAHCRRTDQINDETAQNALESFSSSDDCGVVNSWLRPFFAGTGV